MNSTANKIKNTIIVWLMAISMNSYWQELAKNLETPSTNQKKDTIEQVDNKHIQTIKDVQKNDIIPLSDSTNTEKELPRYGRASIHSAPYLSISGNILNTKPFVALAAGRSKKWFYAELEKWYNPESYKESWNYILPIIGYNQTFWKNDQRKIHPQLIGFGTQTQWLWDKESTIILPNLKISYMPENRKITGRYTYAINPFNNQLDDHIAQINITKPTKDITAGLNVRYNNGVFAKDPTVSAGIELTHNQPIQIGKHIKGNVAVIGNLNISQKINPDINTATKNVFAITTTWNIK